MYIKLAISLLPWISNHSVMMKMYLWVISPIAALALLRDLYLQHIDLLISARFPADTPRARGQGHRRHYRSGSLGRGYEVWSAQTYQTLFWPQRFWPLRHGPEIAVLSHPAATLTKVAGRPAQGQLSPPEGHISPEHHAMEVSSWYSHWTKFPRICPGATVALQSGELGHCQMPLG